MTILTRARCLAGLHSGQWSLPGRRCETLRVCDSCGERQERTHHVWGPFDYVRADECDQVRRCERCGSTQSQSRHEWGPWLYLNTEMNSPQFHTCARCHQSERTAYTMR